MPDEDPQPRRNVFENNDAPYPEEWLTKEYWDAHPEGAERLMKALRESVSEPVEQEETYDGFAYPADDEPLAFVYPVVDGPIYGKDGELTGKAKDDFLQGLKPRPDSDPRENHRI